MGYDFMMECYKNLDQFAFLNSGVIPLGAKEDGVGAAVYRGFCRDVLNAYSLEIVPFRKTKKIKNPIRQEAIQICPNVNFDFFDKAGDWDRQVEEGPRYLFDPVEIRHALECLSSILERHDINHNFSKYYALCDQAIEWGQKVITGWG